MTSSMSESSRVEGALMVVSEMTLSLLAIVLNLVVLISIRAKESLLNNTTNLMLANVSLANLVCAVFVKSIAVIYNGYAVAKQLWQVQLAFCTLHTIAFRTTWAVFPFTLVSLSLHTLSSRLMQTCPDLSNNNKAKENSNEIVAMTNMAGRSLETSFDSHVSHRHLDDGEDDNNHEDDHNNNDDQDDDEDDDEDYSEGPTSTQKGWLATIWLFSLFYALLSEQVLSKERVVPCPLKNELDKRLNIVSMVMVLLLPALLLLLFLPLANCLIVVATGICCRPCCGSDRVDVDNADKDDRDDRRHVKTRKTTTATTTTTTSSSASSTSSQSTMTLQICLVFLFLIVYPTHMVVPELLLDDAIFTFMMVKYCVGCSHLIGVPLVVLLARQEVRRAAVDVALRRLASSKK